MYFIFCTKSNRSVRNLFVINVNITIKAVQGQNQGSVFSLPSLVTKSEIVKYTNEV